MNIFNLLTSSSGESTGGGNGGGNTVLLIVLGVFVVGWIVLSFFTNKKRKKQAEEESKKRDVKPGFIVTTIGGVVGTVAPERMGVYIGTGIGGGIIVNGQIISGSKGGAGEIGHICVNKDETEKCSCGKTGCLEQYASATGIVRMAKEKLHRYDITAKDIFDEAKAGDASANELINQLGEFLGTALASVANVTNPQIFVIGGGVSKAGKILIDATEHHFRKQAFHICSDARFVLAKLGNDAGIYGSVQLILE